MWQLLALSVSWTLSSWTAQVSPAPKYDLMHHSRTEIGSFVMRTKAFGVRRRYKTLRVVAATDGKVVPTAHSAKVIDVTPVSTSLGRHVTDTSAPAAMSFADELAADTAHAIDQLEVECNKHQDAAVAELVHVFKRCCKTAARGGWTFAEWKGKLTSNGRVTYGAEFRLEIERKVQAHHLALRDLAALEEKLGMAITALGVQNQRVAIARRVSDVDVYISAEWPVRPRLPAAGATVPMVSVKMG